MDKEIIIAHETAIQSIIKDTYTFGVLVGLLLLNHYLLGGNSVVYFGEFIIWFMFVFSKRTKNIHRFYSFEKAIEHLEGLKKN